MVGPRRPHLWRKYLTGLGALLAIVAVACGTAAPESRAPATSEQPAAQSEAPALVVSTDTSLENSFGATPATEPARSLAGATATPFPIPTPRAAFTASDDIIFITQEEPDSLSTWSEGCSGIVSSAICEEIASDPLTWIDSASFEVVPLAGVESWSHQGPDRWRFALRDGVTFHNGEPWNAEAAKMGLDYVGDKESSGHGRGAFGFHGVISGKVVDDLTVDVVCEVACPIFPRSAIFTTFQAPEWWTNATADERANMTVGLGPYRIVEHVPGVEVHLEAHEGYKAHNAFDAQAPVIKTARQVWRPEPMARAAMVQAGEGHWAVDVGFENIRTVPVARTGANNEVFTLVADNIWHPELSKKEVRMALAHAVDCQLLMEILYYGLQECIGNISQWGTVGINDTNFAPYEHTPETSRELLASSGYYHADYDPEANNYRVNPSIRIHTRADRVYRGLEMFESVVAGWRELGVNAEMVVLEPSRALAVRRSGCGALDGPELQLDCVNQDPPGVGASTHYYETATSNEMLDMQRQLLLRNSCHNVNSRVCNLVPGLDGMTYQDSIADAIGTPLGPDRQRKMEALAQMIHDEYWFLPFFVSVQVYALATNLEWEPRYDPRIRLNTMRFTEQ